MLGALLLAAIVSGCFLPRSSDGGAFSQENGPRNAPVTVRVINHNWAQMNIYAVVDGQRRRLGTVNTAQNVLLKIPPTLRPDIVPVRFLATPIGDRRRGYLSESIVLNPGDEAVWELENQLRQSVLYRR